MKTLNDHEAKTTLNALFAHPQRVRNSWRDLPGWKGFRYDFSIFAPFDEQQLADEGWH